MDTEVLKAQVHDYWNGQPCGTTTTQSRRFSKKYFDEIEAYRYRVEPDVFSFAQFTRFSGRKVLEVGVGTGTDFIQWVRAGVFAYGVDLTEESIEHVKERLEVYGLRSRDVRVADAENLPYPSDSFDLVYSWGVIHHTPDTAKALGEIIRVAKPGGMCKIMVYNRHSISALFKFFLWGVLKGRFHGISWLLFHRQESIGTKAFTVGEVRDMLAMYHVEELSIEAPVTKRDLMYEWAILRIPACILAYLFGFRKIGWYMTVEFTKRRNDV